MRRSKPQAVRNKLDLADRAQVRLVKKRLGLSDMELAAIVGRIGNSISAISKEAAQRPKVLNKPSEAVIAATVAGEQATTELAAAAPTS
ncbi:MULTISPECIES: DUF3606 domain-containing protein [Bradyrhizobium]|jgi:hypothetical protein|uniref:DUF3606 domain-containing protein n=1 Tax=Bradyrhizobium TaxID=374 RepID=UPI000404A482|nr:MULTISPECIES: DUF3606 domain-containing protein [Bradyrhizobium]KQT19193.1 hypothetical protein ASG57_29280 [Bradyrhizobium sp. Leaf396]